MTKKKWCILAGAAAALLAVLFLAANYLFHFALDPEFGGMIGKTDWEAATDEWLNANGEDRWLVSRDGVDLHAVYVPRPDSHKYVIACHGYGGIPQLMVRFSSWFYEHGYNVLAPAARAHEQSGGRYVSMGWLERLDVVDWAVSLAEQDPEAEIVLYGVSMGGATVMMAAGEDLPGNVKCIVEDCGYSSVWDEFAGQLKEMFGLPTFPVLDAASLVTRIRAGFGFKEASAVEQLKQADLPMLFIHGEEDTFVPYAMLDLVYDACASEDKERLSVPGAAHGMAASTAPELYWSTVAEFLTRYIG